MTTQMMIRVNSFLLYKVLTLLTEQRNTATTSDCNLISYKKKSTIRSKHRKELYQRAKLKPKQRLCTNSQSQRISNKIDSEAHSYSEDNFQQISTYGTHIRNGS